MIETSESPPTYNETNKFTKVFQTIIDSYGVATYQEINPGEIQLICFSGLFYCLIQCSLLNALL